MAMDLLFVMDPIAGLHPRKDTSIDLMTAAQKRRHRVYWCEPRHLRLAGGKVLARAQEVDVDPEREPFFIARTEMELYALNFPSLIPETLITAALSDVRQFIHDVGAAVLKPVDGNGGRGVFVVKKGDSNIAPLTETLTDNGRLAIVVQRFLTEVDQGDKRVILVDGQVLGAINRVPLPGEHRANIHVGGQVYSCTLNDREREVCAALQPRLVLDGLMFVGIDLIGGYLTEINVTSPTGVQEIRQVGGPDISPMVIERLEAMSQGREKI
jgi:glutathione synthase